MARREFRLLTMKVVCICACAIPWGATPSLAALDETPARLEAREAASEGGDALVQPLEPMTDLPERSVPGTTQTDCAPKTEEEPTPGLTPESTSGPAGTDDGPQTAEDSRTVDTSRPFEGGRFAESAFLSARKAYQSKHAEALDVLAEQTLGHPLHGYVELWRILLKLRRAPSDPTAVSRMTAFIAAHPDEYLGERARGEWARIAADNDDAVLFRKLWSRLTWQASEPDLRCHRASVSLLGQPKREAVDDAKRLLAEPDSGRFDACLKLSRSVVRVDPDWAWQQVFLWLQQSRWKDVRSLLDVKSGATFPFDRRAALEIVNTPKGWFKLHRKRLSRVPVRLLAIAALRFANVDRDIAVALVRATGKRANAQLRAVLWGRLGHLAAMDLDPKAVSYFRSAGSLLGKGLFTANAADVLQWQVRAHLRTLDWRGVLRAVQALPEGLRNLPVWQYWKARGLQATRRPAAARAIWTKLRLLPEFYGLLSADALGVPYALGQDDASTSLPAARSTRFAANPHIRRALHFYALDLIYEGNREWNWSMRKMASAERLDLARFAWEQGIAHRAITTSESAGKTVRRLTYPLAHEDAIRRAAKAAELPAHWLFGLIRQESRFVTTARSSVGALGMMQVMPRTARWVAKKTGMKEYRNERLTDPATNLAIGAQYLRLVSESFGDSVVLSTASYNAGPNRVLAWSATLAKPVEGAVFAETIPFRETRDYVQRVTANMVHYSAYDNPTPRRLSDILAEVAPGQEKRLALP